MIPIDPRLKERHIKADRKRNNGNEGIMAEYYRKYEEAF